MRQGGMATAATPGDDQRGRAPERRADRNEGTASAGQVVIVSTDSRDRAHLSDQDEELVARDEAEVTGDRRAAVGGRRT